jgi:hypothetical protein
MSARIERPLGRRKHFDACDAPGTKEITKLVATAITNMDRRLLCINTMRAGFSQANMDF